MRLDRQACLLNLPGCVSPLRRHYASILSTDVVETRPFSVLSSSIPTAVCIIGL
jgi:hypothetical protein